MKILVIFTGGTIGSTLKGEYIGTDENKKYKIIEHYLANGSDVEFDSLEPYCILSENLKGQNINILADCINKNAKLYDGIIVTHGTDTLQYTAAGLSLLFKDNQTPIVLVSSNYVLEDERANGMKNFNAAVNFIEYVIDKNCGKLEEYDYKSFSNIFVAYNNGEEETFIHAGELLLAHTVYEDKVYSLDNCYVGSVRNGLFSANEMLFEEKELVKGETEDETWLSDTVKASVDAWHSDTVELDKKASMVDELDFRINRAKELVDAAFSDKGLGTFSEYSGVVWIKAYPGCSYDIRKEKVKCVLLETYHSGTLNAENESLRKMLEYCDKNNIPVFVTGVEERAQYESTSFYKDYNLVILPKLSPIFVYMLLWLA